MASSTAALGTTWFYGSSAVRPKQTAIDNGKALAHLVFLERVTQVGRQFGSFPSVAHLTRAVGTDNHHLFEIIPEGHPACIYLDVEFVGDGPSGLQDILQKLQAACADLLGVQIQPHELKVSCASGIGESASYAGKLKTSYHVCVDNGWAMASNRSIRDFVDAAFPGDSRVDRAVYSKNQSYRAIHQSKFGSTRVLIPHDGDGYGRHLVTSFAEPPRFYPTDRLRTALVHNVKAQVVRPCPVLPRRPLPFVEDAEDVFSIPTLLCYLPNGPSKADKQTFQTYMTVACICVNEAEPWTTFESWASRYSKYSQTKSRRLWDSLSPRIDGYDLHTLRTLVTQCHPTLFKTMEAKWVHQCTHHTLDLQDSRIDYHTYSEPRMQPWVDVARTTKHVHLKGAMGSGAPPLMLSAPLGLVMITNGLSHRREDTPAEGGHPGAEAGIGRHCHPPPAVRQEHAGDSAGGHPGSSELQRPSSRPAEFPRGHRVPARVPLDPPPHLRHGRPGRMRIHLVSPSCPSGVFRTL